MAPYSTYGIHCIPRIVQTSMTYVILKDPRKERSGGYTSNIRNGSFSHRKMSCYRQKSAGHKHQKQGRQPLTVASSAYPIAKVIPRIRPVRRRGRPRKTRNVQEEFKSDKKGLPNCGEWESPRVRWTGPRCPGDPVLVSPTRSCRFRIYLIIYRTFE